MQFTIATLVTIVDGRLIAPNHMDDVYAILNYMTDSNLTTIGLTMVADECKAGLLEQHPWLEDVRMPVRVDGRNVEEVRAELARKYGEMHEVKPLKNRHTTKVVFQDHTLSFVPSIPGEIVEGDQK